MKRIPVMLSTILVLVLLHYNLNGAETEEWFIEKGTDRQTEYVSGGIGLGERKALMKMAGEYNLKLVFALKTGPYVADIPVVIQDKDDVVQMEAVAAGPFFLTRLPQGRYKISASFRNQEIVQTVELGKVIKTLTFHW